MSISQRFRVAVAVSTVTAMASVIAAAALIGAPAAQASLAPGWLDPSYGTNGVGLVSDPEPSVAVGNAGLIDSHGGVLLLSPPGASTTFSVSRLTPTGVVDHSFGTAGSTTLPTGEAYQAMAAGSGGIYIAAIPTTGNGVSVVHLSTSGQLDASFGTGGVAAVAMPAPITLDVGVTQLDGGDVVVSGAGDPGTPGLPLAGFLAALDSSGNLDAGFNAAGATPGILPTSASLPLHVTHDGPKALVLTEDGSGGATGVSRYDTTGTSDLTAATATGIHPVGLDVGSNGEYYITGAKSHSTSTEFVEAMMNDGTPDATFGSAGVAMIQISGCSPTASSVVVAPSNIYVFGSYPGCDGGQPVVVRLGLDGSIDKNFGSGGVLQTYSDQIAGAAVQDFIAGGLSSTGEPLLALRFATGSSSYASGAIELATTSLAPNGSFVPLLPARVLDTRVGTGAPAGAIPAGGTVTVKLTGRGGIPVAGVGAVALNVTATAGTKGGYVTVYPTGITRPITSNLNYLANRSVANLVTTQLGSGSITLYNGSSGTVQLVADVSGYYLGGSAKDPGTYVALPPKRLLDTRTGHHPTPVAAHGSLTLQVGGRGGVHAGSAGAAVLNVTVTSATQSGYVSVYPDGTPRPVASNINHPAGVTVAGLVTVKLSSAGAVTLYNGSSGTAHLIADVEGYYITGTPTESGTFVALAPTRVLDTRVGTGAPTGPIAANHDLLLNLAGKAGIPATGASAVVVNGTVTQPTFSGFLTYTSQDTFYTSDYPTSTLNFAATQTVANLAMIDGTHLVVHNASAGTSQALADVAGYFLR